MDVVLRKINAGLFVLWLCGCTFAFAQDNDKSTSDTKTKSSNVKAKDGRPVEPSPPNVGSKLNNARATMQTFINACNRKNYSVAIDCLDFSAVPASPALGPEDKEEYARKLKGIIDRLDWVDYARISNDPKHDAFRFPIGKDEQPIVIAPDSDGTWRFTADVVAQIPDLWNEHKDLPLIVGPTPWYRATIPIINNAAWRIAALFAAILVSIIVGRIVRMMITGAAATLEKRRREITSVALRALSRAIAPLIWVVGANVGLKFLVLNLVVQEFADTIISILFAIAVGYVAYCMVEVVDAWLHAFSARTESKLDDMLVPMVRTSLRVTIVILLLVQIATILSDKPVTSIIAGLSVGGLAIGLAAQETIKNFFGSIMIFSDKPFELGDRIVVDGFDGPVESVGFRSTRIRTLEGHLVTIPNGELANKSILNISKRPSLRRKLDITVTYDTSPENVQKAVDIIKDILQDHEGMDAEKPPRVFFNEFNDVSLNISVTYWYHPPDYWDFSEFNERVNFEILNRFNAEGIEFAFPTQTLYLAGDPKRPLPPLGTAGAANDSGP